MATVEQTARTTFCACCVCNECRLSVLYPSAITRVHVCLLWTRLEMFVQRVWHKLMSQWSSHLTNDSDTEASRRGHHRSSRSVIHQHLRVLSCSVFSRLHMWLVSSHIDKNAIRVWMPCLSQDSQAIWCLLQTGALSCVCLMDSF